ncbi:MAG: DEAD/DEAH box helicase family protein [Ornithinimicrobium sp.]
MRVVLKGYQTEAVKAILKALARTRNDWHNYQEQSAFALSAPTSSGKTVIAAAAIEAMLHGSDEFDVEADPSAVFLWVSKDPALNEQTKARFKQHADQIPYSNLVTLDKDYSAGSLATGKVYFINPQKLASSAGFVRYSDKRNMTFWDILDNTIKDPRKTLYMVLDEAHEGMRPPTSADQTIVMRIINGNGHPGVPVVWGISATLDRFTNAMEGTPTRVKRPNIEIDPKEVQASGLIKTAIHLDIPDEEGYFDTAMVRDATEDFVDVCRRWERYTDEQGLEESVVPLLVVQIRNKAVGESQTDKGRKDEEELIHLVLETIRESWPQMPDDGVAHVVGEGRGAITVGDYVIPRVKPQLVQQQTHIRVLIAKDAISTGWDCPRAEVLVSLRPGKDPTYVTQLIGRMVRTPLAQSTSVDRLNAASAYLPKFDLETTQAVVDELLGEGKNRDKGRSTSLVQKVLLKPVTLVRNPHIPVDVADTIEALPSYGRASTVARPIKRLLKAAQAFAQDGLVPDANKVAHETLYAVLDGVKTTYTRELVEQVDEVLAADIRRIRVDLAEKTTEEQAQSRAADAGTVDDALRHLHGLLTKSVVNGYLARDVQAAIAQAETEGGSLLDVDLLELRAHVAALGQLKTPDDAPTVRALVEDAADVLTRQWLNVHAAKIAKLADTRKAVYEEVRGMARDPEPATIEIAPEERVDTVDKDLKRLPTVERHVLATDNGEVPLEPKLNRWERGVIRHELTEDSMIGWYRNPSVAGDHSLRVPYKAGKKWKSVQPDLIFVHQDDEGMLTTSLIDPHGAHQGDASPKLKALAEYAARHGSSYARIVVIGVETSDHELLALDLLDPSIQRAVFECPADKDSVVALFTKHGTKYAAIPA